jgi:hypothetical protein
MVQDQPTRLGRRLSAILAADVAGYSRLMHADEEATHTRLGALLAGAAEPAIAEHRGRVVKNTGDGFLAEFPSAVEAVRAATYFQNRVRELTTGDPDDKRLLFRVGINIGDIIVEAHDIFGDGEHDSRASANPAASVSLPLTIRFAARSRSSSPIWVSSSSRTLLFPCEPMLWSGMDLSPERGKAALCRVHLRRRICPSLFCRS